jgi:TRAP-type C4-dicarboxylate transport system permease small subunit
MYPPSGGQANLSVTEETPKSPSISHEDVTPGEAAAGHTSAACQDPGAIRTLRAIDNALGTFEHALLAALLLMLIGVGAGQAIATKLGASWAWSFEIIRYSVFFIAMTGAALSAHTEQLIAMDFVTRMISPRTRARLRVVLRLFTVAVCVLLIIGGRMLSGAASDTLYHVINPRWGLMALPIGAGLIAVHVLLHTAIDLIYLLHGRTPPEGALPRSAH